MPAPPAALVTALRDGTVFRHMFFYLDHPDGAARMWDGVGQFVLNGQTFLGIGGLAAIDGISNSRDLQNHSVALALNGVPLSSLTASTSVLQGRAAVVTMVLIQESGAVLASKEVFTGSADILRSMLQEDKLTLKLNVRGPMADWGLAPRAFWSQQDQALRYAGDTGFSQMKYLESPHVAGWSLNVEATGGGATFAAPSSLKDSASNGLLGCPGFGAFIGLGYIAATNGYRAFLGNHPSGISLVEDTTGAANDYDQSSGRLAFGGTPAYVDVAGEVRTPGGQRIRPSTGSTLNNRLRLATAVAIGTATAENISSFAYSTVFTYFRRTSQTVSVAGIDGGQSLPLIFANDGGVVTANSFSANFVEETTGATVTGSGATMATAAGNCVLSTTGVVLTPAGKRVHRVGSTAAASFLRVFS